MFMTCHGHAGRNQWLTLVCPPLRHPWVEKCMAVHCQAPQTQTCCAHILLRRSWEGTRSLTLGTRCTNLKLQGCQRKHEHSSGRILGDRLHPAGLRAALRAAHGRRRGRRAAGAQRARRAADPAVQPRAVGGSLDAPEVGRQRLGRPAAAPQEQRALPALRGTRALHQHCLDPRPAASCVP